MDISKTTHIAAVYVKPNTAPNATVTAMKVNVWEQLLSLRISNLRNVICVKT